MPSCSQPDVVLTAVHVGHPRWKTAVGESLPTPDAVHGSRTQCRSRHVRPTLGNAQDPKPLTPTLPK